MADPLSKEEDIQHRPDSPPLGLLDPSRIQNPLANDQLHQVPQQQNPSGFVMPEQPRQQVLIHFNFSVSIKITNLFFQPPPQTWQRTPTMSPANIFQGGENTHFKSKNV